jgi:hypothetical protein
MKKRLMILIISLSSYFIITMTMEIKEDLEKHASWKEFFNRLDSNRNQTAQKIIMIDDLKKNEFFNKLKKEFMDAASNIDKEKKDDNSLLNNKWTYSRALLKGENRINTKENRFQYCNYKNTEIKDINNHEKPLYTGTFAHLSQVKKYNINSNNFEKLNITTGIIYGTVINFATNKSPWFLYYINQDYNKYKFNIKLEETDSDKQKAKKIKILMEELYSDINRRIFDIFDTAFTLAQKNKKSDLMIKIPNIAMEKFLKGIEDTPIASFIVGCYYNSFIRNFENFFTRKNTYNIDTFKIIFVDDSVNNIMNNTLRHEINRYIAAQKVTDEIKIAFENFFITNNKNTDMFTLEEDIQENNNNQIIIFVREEDEQEVYLEGCYSKTNPLDTQFLGIRKENDLSCSFLVFTEAPSFAELYPYLLAKDKTVFEKVQKAQPSANKLLDSLSIKTDQYINDIKKKADGIISLFHQDHANYIEKIQIENNIITLPRLNAFISGEVTKQNNGGDRFNKQTSPMLIICIEHKRFEDIFIAALKKLMTENTNVVTIDIDSYLEKIKDSFLKKPIENLIHKSIYNIIKNKTLHMEKILFKYTKFYDHIIHNLLLEYYNDPYTNKAMRIHLLEKIQQRIENFTTFEKNVIPDYSFQEYLKLDFNIITNNDIDKNELDQFIKYIENINSQPQEININKNILPSVKKDILPINNDIYQITIPIEQELAQTLNRATDIKILIDFIFKKNNCDKQKTEQIMKKTASQPGYMAFENDLMQHIIGYRLYIVPNDQMKCLIIAPPCTEGVIKNPIPLNGDNSNQLINAIQSQHDTDTIKRRRESYIKAIENIFIYNKKFSLLPFHILVSLGGLGVGILLVVVLKYGFNMKTENIQNFFLKNIFTKKNSN